MTHKLPVRESAWAEDLTPIEVRDWGADRAMHLLERAGFGGTPEDVERFAAMTPQQAVRHLVRFEEVSETLPPFDESNIFEPSLDPFPPSRPAVTDEARAKGAALGIQVKT